MSNLNIIGIHEYIQIKEASIQNLASKTDTGAYNCAIDCSFAQITQNKEGLEHLEFILLSPNHPLYTGKLLSTTDFKQKQVRSSNGHVTTRFQIKLKIELKGEHYKTTFNLSNRSKMRYAVLLGRKFLANRFLVDVSKHRKLKKLKTK